MESVGQARLLEACNLLGVPGPGPSDLDADSDEGEVVIGIRPKSSPQPRRRSWVSDEDSEPEPPPPGSRRVSFADAKGLSLVQVKEFDAWDVPKLPGYESPEGEEAEEFFLSPLTFSLPLSTELLSSRVRDQKVELESIRLLPRTTILKGVVRVLNVSFHKAIYIRTSLDAWSTHFDLLAEYVPGSSDGVVDLFSFKLTLVPPFGEQGARVEFCLRYETPVGTFWANNHNRNYVLACHQRVKDRTQGDNGSKKSCLKTISHGVSPVEPPEDVSAVVSINGEEVKTSNSQSETDRQKLKTENRRLGGRRSGRKAARTARVRDYFAQRGEERKDSAEAKQKEQVRTEQPPDEPSLSEQRPEYCHLVSEPPLTPSKSPSRVLHRALPATDAASDGEPEKPESKDLAVTLTGGEDATDTVGNPLPSHDEAAPSECHNINKCVCRAQCKSAEATSNAAAQQGDGKEGGGERFGTVVAPLYQQMFGQRNPKNPAGCFGRSTDVNVPSDQAQRDESDSQESNLEGSDNTSNVFPTEEEQAEGIQGHGESLQDQGEVAPEIPNSEVKATQMAQMESNKKGSQTEAEDPSKPPGPLTPHRIQASATEETQNVHRDSLKEDFSTLRNSLETRDESASCNHTSGDMFVPFKDEDAAEERTWEMMVEEEEQSILTDPEEKNTEDTGAEAELENRETTEREDERAEEGSSPGENRTTEDEDAEWMEDMERDEEEGTWEEERTDVQKEEDEQEMEMYMNTIEDDVKPKDAGVEEEGPTYKEDCVHRHLEVGDTDLKVANSEVALSQVADLEVADSEFANVDSDVVDADSHVADSGAADADSHDADAESDIADADSEVADADSEAGDSEVPATDSKGLKAEEGNDDVMGLDPRLAVTQSEGEVDVLSGLMPDIPAEEDLYEEDGFITKQQEEDSADELEHDQTGGHDSASDSDDEVELYMHCLRAVHTGSQAQDRGFSAAKRPSISRGKLLSTPMPSISESLDEEPHLACPEDDHEDMDMTDFQPVPVAPPLQSQNTKVHWWKATFSCRNITKTLLFSTLMVLFFVTAYHYDFIACLGLYVISVVWLYCQGERQPAKSSNRLG